MATNTNLRLSGVPALMFVGIAAKGLVVANLDMTASVTWSLSATGLTINPDNGSLPEGAIQEVTITPTTVGLIKIDLSDDKSNAAAGSPVTTSVYAAPPALQRYYELLAELETLKF